MSIFGKLFGAKDSASNALAANQSTVQDTVADTVPTPVTTVQDPNPVGVRHVINVMSNKPIDAAYQYIKRDNQNLGYNDAIVLADVQFMQKGIDNIKNEFRVLLKQIRLKYEDAAMDSENKIKVFESMFMSTSQQDEQSRLNLIKFHLEELNKMEKDLDEDAPTMQNMVDSYRRGFMTGIIAKKGNVITPITAPLPASPVNAPIVSTVTTIG